MARKNGQTVSRRRVLQASAGLTLGGVLGGSEAMGMAPQPNVYESLGLKPVINAAGTFTNLGGSIMPPEVAAAWVEASRHFVNLTELQDRVGERIAKLIGVEAALVTTGAAGALLLGTAAAVTQGDAKLLRKLPDTSGMKNEVLIQKSHHSCYDNQLTNVGVRLIDVETIDDVRRAISDRTALMFFMNYLDEAGKISRKEWVRLARQHKVPTLLDAAADSLPVERLSEYNRLGFDLVAFSGGKAIRGPNDTGLLLGRKDLVEAAKKNANPHCPSIGRMMKVSKEDQIALLTAVERFIRLDHRAERREWERRLEVIEKAVQALPSIRCERITPAIANEVPHLQITWDEKRLRISREDVTQELLAGDPPIVLGRVHGTGDRGILVSVFVLKEGEERIVADRLAQILSKAARRKERKR